jgi:ABC-type maltose transport system permease subunit
LDRRRRLIETFLEINIPLLAPGLVATGLITFIPAYNELDVKSNSDAIAAALAKMDGLGSLLEGANRSPSLAISKNYT